MCQNLSTIGLFSNQYEGRYYIAEAVTSLDLIEMGLFGGTPESSSSSDYGSKLRPYSSGDETLSDGGFPSAGGLSAGAGAAGGDFQTQLQVAQETNSMMTQMHHINEVCWDICITGNPSSSFSGREQSCLPNCVDRFVDTTLLITNRSVDTHQY